MAESAHKEEDVYNVCQKDIMDNLDWLKAATNDQKKRLRDYLLNLDRSKRVDFHSVRSKIICGGVHDIMMQICEKMKEKDPRFSGNLVPMGSANNKTKIDDLNEFDFVHELAIFNLLRGKGTFSRYLKVGERFRNRIGIGFVTDADFQLCAQFTLKGAVRLHVGHLSDHVNTEQNIFTVLDIPCIHDVYSEILSNVLQELELPPGWCHGGLNRPNFSGIRLNGIACLLQFEHMGTDEKTPLRMSVDYSPMIRIPIVTDKRNTFGICVTELTGVDHCWASLANERLFYSNAEELWLSEYSSDSMPKTLMRLGKYVEVLLKMKYKCPIPEDELNKIENGTWEMGKEVVALFYDIDEFVTYSDLGETVGDICLVKSYAIKKIVMYMMMASESRGHKWTEDDLPDLLMCVYRILTDANFTRDSGSGFELVEYKFSVPLEEKLEINEDLKNSIKLETEHPRKDFNLEDTLIFLHRQHGSFLRDIRNYFSSDGNVLLCRMSAVFQLLRCVCEGHNTADIVTYKRVHPIELSIGYVPKEELKELLPTFLEKKVHQKFYTQQRDSAMNL